MTRKLRLIALLLSCTMLFQLMPLSALAESDLAHPRSAELGAENSVAFAGGNGTTDDPYQIATAQQLDAVREHLDAHFVLTNDIDLSGYDNWEPIGNDKAAFTGSLDGQSYTISNLTIDADSQSNRFIGLFGCTGASFSNVILEDVDIDIDTSNYAFYHIGALAGYAKNLINCSASGSIDADFGGGIIDIGGLVGHLFMSGSIVSACKSYIDITFSASGCSLVGGGIVGCFASSSSDVPFSSTASGQNNLIEECDNYGNIHATCGSRLYANYVTVCGIAGYADCSSTVAYCRNFADLQIDGTETYTLCGIAYSVASGGSIRNSVNYGSLEGGQTGSISGIGCNSIDNCYNASALIQGASNCYRIGSGYIADCYSLETTLVNGEIPTEYIGSDKANGLSISKEELYNRISEIFQDQVIPDLDVPVIQPGNTFRLSRDAFDFNNSDEDFRDKKNQSKYAFVEFLKDYFQLSTPEYEDTKYSISTEKLNQLIDGYLPRVQAFLIKKAEENWTGSCYGMISVAALRFLHPDRIPLTEVSADASRLHDLKAPNKDSTVEDLVNYYYLMQFAPTVKKIESDRSSYYLDDYQAATAEIIRELQNGYPVMATIRNSAKGSRHAILLLSIADETSSYYKIRVYDPNNHLAKQTLMLHKSISSGQNFIPITYGSYDQLITSLFPRTDYTFIDLKNFFLIDNFETADDFDERYVTLKNDCTVSLKYSRSYYRKASGELAEYSSDLFVSEDAATLADGTYRGSTWITLPKTTEDVPLELELLSDGVGNADILLDETLLSVSTSGPIKLTYNEKARTVDITADTPTDVSLLMTQNTVTDNWPWHSWALDTTGTTTLRAELDEDGLHLTGDGITNANYAVENADTNALDSGSIPVQPDEITGLTSVTILNKNQNSSNKTEISAEDLPAGTHSITVWNGSADPSTAQTGTTVTITADDKTASGKVFTHWTVDLGDVAVEDASSTVTSFVMGNENVTLTAHYESSDSSDTPSSGGGDDGGAAILILGAGVVAAAAAVGAAFLLPVKVQGKVEIAEQHLALPNAKLSLVKDGKVVAQTTADENGAFTLKAKRGSYELVAAYTNENGQLVHQTFQIKAPSKNLTITF